MNPPSSTAARLAAGALALATVATLAACQTPGGADVTRYPNDGAGAVTSKAVEVGAGTALVLVSGNTPLPADPAASESSPAYWGDTEAQTASAFRKIAAALAGMGLGMRDVVKVQAYLVGPAHGQSGDLAGFGRAYARAFGVASDGRLPARTVVTVAALGRPGMLVEIEVTAARPPRAAAPAGAHARSGHP